MRMSVVFVKDKELEKQEKIFVVISVLTVVKFMNTLKVGKKILGIEDVISQKLLSMKNDWSVWRLCVKTPLFISNYFTFLNGYFFLA